MNNGTKMEEKILEIVKSLNINMDGYPDKDIDLVECLEDSIQLVILIVSIEEELQITIPDDLLMINNFHSLKKFLHMLKRILFN